MKGRYLVLAALFIVVLTGCDKKKTLTCTKSENTTGMTLTTTNITEFINDKISLIKMDVDVKLESNYVKYKDTIKKSLENQYSTYKNVKGITYHADVKNDTLTFSLVVDNKSISKNVREKLSISDKDNYEKSKKDMESDGYTCK